MIRISDPRLRMQALLAAALLATTVAVGCGGDDNGDANGGAEAAAAGDCAGRFNDVAPDQFPRLIRLSHAPGREILTGTFAGAEFMAEVFDRSRSGDGVESTVPEGACVVAEESRRLGALYIFAVAEDGAWHRFSETDPAVPLAGRPVAAQLADVVVVDLSDVEPPGVPELVGAG